MSYALYSSFLSIIVVIAFAVLLNCFYHNPQLLPFPSDSPPHPTEEGEGVRGQLHGSLLLTETKPQHVSKMIFLNPCMKHGLSSIYTVFSLDLYSMS